MDLAVLACHKRLAEGYFGDRHITNRWTRAAGARFSTCSVRRRVL
jgi:hypothetical protein